jgi:hypothetical protein
MAYICVIDNNFTNSCNIVISHTIIKSAHLVIKVSDKKANDICNAIIEHLIYKHYKIKRYIYTNNFYYDCTYEIISFVKLSLDSKDYEFIDPKKSYFCCF